MWLYEGFNTQKALSALLENWRKSLDNNGFGGAILLDLSKAFHTSRSPGSRKKIHPEKNP